MKTTAWSNCRCLTMMICRKYKTGDRVFNTLLSETGLICEIAKYGYIVNYSDRSGIKFRKSKEENLKLTKNEENMKKGDLVRHKHSKKTGTIITKPFKKLFRDASDWEAMSRGGGDYATAATAIRVLWHDDGYERTYKQSTFRRNHEVIEASSCDLKDKKNNDGI